ncbi:MAG: lytic transglycosylase domain-containing protein [Bryobacteraceae bacterium]
MQLPFALADECYVWKLCSVLFAIAVVLPAQTPSPQDAIRVAMEQAANLQRAAVANSMARPLADQHASVRKQAESQNLAIQETGDSAFALPWPTAVSPLISELGCDPMPKEQISALVDQTAKQEGVNPALLHAVAAQESGFRPCAVSAKGALGLMQLMPETQQHFHVTDPFDPGQSLTAGSRLLKQLLDRYHGDLSLALSAYNAGAGRVDQADGIPPIAETQNYVTGVLTRLQSP